MDAYSIMWYGGDDGYDIHLMPGDSSWALKDSLYIFTSKDSGMYASQLPANQGITVSFAHFLTGNLATYGLTFVPASGLVTYSGTVKLRNFLVEARVTDQYKTLTTVIRVHLHKSITAISLTPAPLTLKKGGSGQRLTVLANFDDKTSGDITRHPRIQWKSSNPSVISFDATQSINLAPTTKDGKPILEYGAMYALATAGTASIEATLTKAAGLTGPDSSKIATATVAASGSWADPREAILVGNSPGAQNMSLLYNVIFLSDGFLLNDGPFFREYVTSLVRFLQTSPIAQPYGYLKYSINYWMVFVPSVQQGASILNPIYLKGNYWLPVPDPKRLPPPDKPWDVGNLIYAVGLPNQADKGISYGTKAIEWGSYSYFKNSYVTDVVYKQWLRYADQTMAFETDTVLGIALGDRGRASNSTSDRVPTLHPFRSKRSDLDKLFMKLTFYHAQAKGNAWVKGGQDDSFVFVVSNAPRYGGVSHPSLKLVTAGMGAGEGVKGTILQGKLNLTLTPPHPAMAKEMDWFPTVFHELTHAFGLLDEYGGASNIFPKADETTLANVANLQSKSELVDPNEKLKGENIKWRWPRMTKAGRLSQKPTRAGNEVELVLKAGHGEEFNLGDVVRLRTKGLFDKDTTTKLWIPPSKAWMKITSIERLSNQPTLLTADVVTELSGSEFDKFDKESVLYVPVTEPPNTVPASAQAATDKEYLLVHPEVTKFISANGALNAKGSNKQACVEDKGEIQGAPNFPRNLLIRFKQKLVGLFDGGAAYYCGVYHPSGECSMRALASPRRLKEEELDQETRPSVYPDPARARQFIRFLGLCPVCRYYLVDKLNVTLHGQLDRDYARKYPTKKP